MAEGITLKATLRMLVYAGIAKPSPKLGQALGPYGVNMMQFCKEFNERTSMFKPEAPMRVKLKAYSDRSFKFVVKPPPTSWFLKRAAGVAKGSDSSKLYKVGKVGIKYIYEIAKIKIEADPDLQGIDIKHVCRMIISQADAMGLEVVEDVDLPEIINIPVKAK